MINLVWLFLMVLGITTAITTGKIMLISEIIFSSTERAITFCIGLAGTLAFWSGILKIAEAAGLTTSIAKIFQPLLRWIFPTLTNQPKAIGLISMTLAANLLGLGNLATPLGLKTMNELQQLNSEPKTASNEICTFIILILGGLTLIPSTLIAIRTKAGSNNPALILGPVFCITLIGTIVGLCCNYLLLRIAKQRSGNKK